jgi:hypothetical protein
MESIFIVFEQGAGIIHRAFTDKTDAQAFVDELEAQTEMNCFEIQKIYLVVSKNNPIFVS